MPREHGKLWMLRQRIVRCNNESMCHYKISALFAPGTPDDACAECRPADRPPPRLFMVAGRARRLVANRKTYSFN